MTGIKKLPLIEAALGVFAILVDVKLENIFDMDLLFILASLFIESI
jgi:hypothetical protein